MMAASVVVPTAALPWIGGSDDVVGRTLSRQPMQRVRAWSYSLYLRHWPPLAILAARWNGPTTTQAVLIVLASVAPAVASHHLIENPVQLQIEGMLDAYDQLRASGSEPVILLDNDQPGMKVYECVSTHLADLAACSFDRSRPTRARPTQQAVADIGGYATIDLADHICPTQTCMPVIGNVLVYRQGSHISNTYARTLVDVLDERLSPLVEAYRTR
jgi:hypothetical protein